MFSTTEITSHEDLSDNVIHQRLFFAYVKAAEMIGGDVLEIGCGAGRGLEAILDKAASYTAIDKNGKLLESLAAKYPGAHFVRSHIPPLAGMESNRFDFVLSFQVIEHIENDRLFLEEIHRVLRPGGKAIVTTPNIRKSLTRNPWHVREYTAGQLAALVGGIFPKAELLGVDGNEKIWDYYRENETSVKKITRFDVLGLQHRLPRQVLQVPYDLLNRLNRKSLMRKSSGLVKNVSTADYSLSNTPETCFDFFCVAEKQG